MGKLKIPEVLAPAGSYESLVAAVNAGADAVYIGGQKFGARAYADNPLEDELLKGIEYAHHFGVKVYMTVNTLLKEKEMKELFSYILPYYEAGLDAIIVQDLGVFDFIRKHFPNIDIHASTQMSIMGYEAVKKLEELDKEYKKAVDESNLKYILVGDRFPFRYLVDDYGLKYSAAFVGCSAETEASFDTITFLSGKLDELGLKNVVTIENSDQKIAKTIIENTKNKDQGLVVLNSLQSVSQKEIDGGLTYLSVMKDNLEVLKKALANQ